jgi:integrase/recombinase XerC
VADVTAGDVGAHLRRLLDLGRSAGTYNRQRGALCGLFAHAVRRGLARENVAHGAPRLQEQERTPPHLSREELARLLEASAGRPIHVGIALMALAGLRVGEAARLRWSDVDLAGRILTVRHETKTRRVRVVPIASRLATVLERQVPRRGIVWRKTPTARHERQVNANRQLDAAARAAGIERHVWPHLLRHTFASHLAAAGVSIWKIARWLGHANVQQTMRYAHLAPQHDEEIDRVG